MLRARILLLTTLSISTFVGFGALSHFTLQEAHNIADEMQKSSRISYLIHQSQNTKAKHNWKQDLATLNKNLKPEFRESAIEKYLQSPSKSRSLLVLETEDRLQLHLSKTHKYLVDRARHQSVIALVAGVLLSIVGFLYVVQKVLLPIKSLDARMNDFLANRYSYEFEAPEPNEVGDLHASFNALAQKVLHQIEDLKALDKAKSEFLSIASHELRTPLTSIKGSLSLMQAGVVEQLNDKSKNLLGIALTETDRLIRLINELLDLAKIEAKKFPLKKAWLPVDKLVESTLQALDGLAKTANVKLEKQINILVDAHMDADRIQQVLTNLSSNAIKFSPSGSTVTIRLSERDQALLFEVIDQGRGIAPEDQVLLFEKFRQVTNAENPLVKGTGLGLAIAKALVEEHKGQIGVTSKPNQGSTFWFTLPEYRHSTSQAEAS